MIEQLTTQQRKVAYLIGIVVLMVPVIWLGMPSSEASAGGKLSSLRQQYELGEATLGKVDPTSATMNLVLLGMRGVAVNLLRMELDEQKDRKQWAQMRATTESVILLQPHYIQVWRYLGWNLAYNVSAEWDAVEDRYFWVKEGAKFLMQGTKRNEKHPEVYWETGRTIGQKIGRADEWKHFRKFFKYEDPDKERFGGNPDNEINPDRMDNYLAARVWYQKANDAEEKHVQHIMMRALFRSYPARSSLDYAEALQREGQFDDQTRQAWANGFDDWVNNFGKMEFVDDYGTSSFHIRLESYDSDVQEIAKQYGIDPAIIRKSIDFHQDVTNYRFWRMRAHSEMQETTVEVHRNLYDGEQRMRKGSADDIDQAEKMLVEGLNGFAKLIRKYPDLASDDNALEECLWGILLWQKIFQLKNGVQPDVDQFPFPLKELWEQQQPRIPNLQQDFNRKYGPT